MLRLCRSVLFWRLLVAFFLLHSIQAPAGIALVCLEVENALDPNGLPPKPIVLAQLPDKLIEKIAAVTGDDFHPFLFSSGWVDFRYGIGERPGGIAKIRYNGQDVARYDVFVKGTTMRFDITVAERFRGKSGLYHFLLANALAIYPETKSIPSRMPYPNKDYPESDNAKGIIDSVFGGLAGMQAFDVQRAKTKDLEAFRKKALEAFYGSAALKVRASNGFAKLTKIIFHPPSGGLAFVVEKGDRLPDSEVRIYMDGPSAHEILPDGKLREQKNKAALSLGDYAPDHDDWN